VVTTVTVEPRLTAVVAEATTWAEYPTVWPRQLDEVYGVVRPRPELSPGDGWHNVMLYKDDADPTPGRRAATRQDTKVG
jgi:hypothetical protein